MQQSPQNSSSHRTARSYPFAYHRSDACFTHRMKVSVHMHSELCYLNNTFSNLNCLTAGNYDSSLTSKAPLGVERLG